MNTQNTEIGEFFVLRTKADVNKFTESEYRADLIRHSTPKTWEEICEDEEEFLRICEEEEKKELEEELISERLELISERQELISERQELISERQELEREKLEFASEKLEFERERLEILRKEVDELSVRRKALFADGKYVLEEGEILE
jgi:uncharacterized protein (DUF3084 family)